MKTPRNALEADMPPAYQNGLILCEKYTLSSDIQQMSSHLLIF